MHCRVERIFYWDQESGYCAVALSTEDPGVPKEAISPFSRGDRAQFSANGYQIPPKEKVEVEVDGHWETNKKYGLQMVVDYCVEIIPRTRGGIIDYLSSGLIKGIGPRLAAEIVKKFGEDTLDIMDNEPERLLEVKGISKTKMTNIMDAYTKSKSIRDIMTYLAPTGITPKKAAKIQKQLGSDTIKMLHADPYMICNLAGFRFSEADKVARAEGIAINDRRRISAAIETALKLVVSEGHLFLGRDDMMWRARTLLNNEDHRGRVSDLEIKQQTNTLVQEKKLIYERGRLFLPCYYYAEKTIAEVVADDLSAPKEGRDWDPLIDEAQRALSIVLAGAQREAVKVCLENRLSILTGGPGTGKTTTLQVILYVYQKAWKKKHVLLAAPTGRASRRMSESTGQAAMTLHKALGLPVEDEDGPWTFWEQRCNPVDADFVIVDETSMAEIRAATELFRRCAGKTRLLLVGDPAQLPPVGGGNVFRDLIQSGRVPTVELDTVFRQSTGSRIAINAQRIRDGGTDLLYGDDFEFVPTLSAAETADTIAERFRQEILSHHVEDVQVLTPMREKDEASVRQLNALLRDLANPPAADKPCLQLGNRSYRLGDKVIQTKNREECSNGDIGFITNVSIGTENDSTITVTYPGNRDVVYEQDDLIQLRLALATTIHKAQGSEYPVVILPVIKGHQNMLRRDLVYTAVTRARVKVILVGQIEMLFTAIRRYEANRRNTMLGSRILDSGIESASPAVS